MTKKVLIFSVFIISNGPGRGGGTGIGSLGGSGSGPSRGSGPGGLMVVAV